MQLTGQLSWYWNQSSRLEDQSARLSISFFGRASQNTTSSFRLWSLHGRPWKLSLANIQAFVLLQLPSMKDSMRSGKCLRDIEMWSFANSWCSQLVPGVGDFGDRFYGTEWKPCQIPAATVYISHRTTFCIRTMSWMTTLPSQFLSHRWVLLCTSLGADVS